jgi:ATP-dependent Zn protease
MVIKPKHQREDAYTVVGFVVYQQMKKRTQIQVLLMPMNDIGICSLSFESFLRICEDPHRIMLANEESVKASRVARQIVGLISKHHSKVTKVVINLFSPRSPGYTVFEGTTSNIYTREALFEHLMILLAGRVAEELFYDVSVTTGAINDFEEALKLAEKMIVYYGMGSNVIYPNFSEKYKELIDIEVAELIGEAYRCCEIIVGNAKEFIYETSEVLKSDRLLRADQLNTLIDTKYPYLRL